MSNLATHNGKFTVTSVKTGEHRTFLVKTQKNEDGVFARGKRIVYLLTGNNNEHDYTPFAWADVNEGIKVWYRLIDTQYATLTVMLNNLDVHEAAGRVIVQAETRCRKCNRTLTNPESISSGIGPICEEVLV